MMRALLFLAVVLALVPVEGLAKGATWQQRRVMVYDFAGPDWSPYLQDAVNRYNAMLPKKAPELVYVSMNGPCVSQKRAITICVGPEAAEKTTLVTKGGEIRRAGIDFTEAQPPLLLFACRELSHAMGVKGQGDWAYVEPCPYDDGVMRRLYGSKRRHR